MGNHTWATVSPSPAVLNSHPEAWLDVSLRDRPGGSLSASQHPLPSWFPLLVSQPKLVASSMPFLGLALPAPPLGGLPIYGQGFGCSGAYECASHYLEGRGEERGQVKRAS